MKKLFSFLLIAVLIACSKDVEEPVLFTLTATANPTEGGTVSPTNGQYESGDVATVTATPNAEYVFEKWTGGATGTSSSVSVTMNGNKSVVANFIKKQYPLTIEIEGEGTVTETVIKQGLATDYNSGTIVELTAEPTGDWEFVEWSGDITSTENPVQITIDGPKTVKSVFIRKRIETKFVDGPVFFLPKVNYFIDNNNLNLSQMKQPIWVGANYISDESDVIADNDWVVPSDYLVDDFNNDGYSDLFFTYITGGERSNVPFTLMLYDETKKTMIDQSNLITNNIGQSFSRKAVSADLNSDGIKDFISVSHPEIPEKEFSYLDIVLSNGNNWEQKTLSVQSRRTDVYEDSGYYHGVDVGDIDNDGDIDIIVAMWSNPNKGISLWKNDGTANFTEFNRVVLNKDGEFAPFPEKESSSFTVDLIDYNNDNCLDLAYSSNPTIIKLGNCEGNFGPESYEFDIGHTPGVIMTDLNNDGLKDLVFRSWGDGSTVDNQGEINIFKQISDGKFEFTEKFIAKGIGDPIEIKDINDDGFPDIIGRDARSYGDGSLFDGGIYNGWGIHSVLIGSENLSFKKVQYPIISQPENIHYDNDTGSLKWTVGYFIENSEENPMNFPHLENLRGNIKKWIIHKSDEPFYFENNETVLLEILDSEITKTKKFDNNTVEYSYNIDNNITGYYRIGYLDSNDVYNSLSYEVELKHE